MTRTRIVDASTLKPGDRIHVPYEANVDVTILREAEPCRDRFGRELQRFWSRREDTGAEGFMSYGPGGIVHLVRRGS
jgi:hypothetical protein